MRVEGTWHFCDDGVTRPIFWAEVLRADGQWSEIAFLADCGADRTVLSQAAFAGLGIAAQKCPDWVTGIGGKTEPIVFHTQIRIPRDDGVALSFRGQFAAVLDSSALDMSLLGRDITNHFSLVVDRPNDTVCLLSRGEVYHA